MAKSYGAGFTQVAWVGHHILPVLHFLLLMQVYLSQIFPFGLIFSFGNRIRFINFSFDSRTKLELRERLKNLEIEESIDEQKAIKKD